jgi:hypothetical protein
LIAQIPEIEGTITTVDCFNVSVKKSIIKIADTVNKAKGKCGWHYLLLFCIKAIENRVNIATTYLQERAI